MKDVVFFDSACLWHGWFENDESKLIKKVFIPTFRVSLRIFLCKKEDGV